MKKRKKRVMVMIGYAPKLAIDDFEYAEYEDMIHICEDKSVFYKPVKIKMTIEEL